jgi:hypothetical protein
MQQKPDRPHACKLGACKLGARQIGAGSGACVERLDFHGGVFPWVGAVQQTYQSAKAWRD